MRTESLNNVTHKDVRIITENSSKFASGARAVPVVPREFHRVQACYPIFLTKIPETGEFVFSALFGFDEGENLFAADGGWDANYIPLQVQREPFVLGRQEGAAMDDAIVLIDMDNPRVSQTEGEAVFLAEGGMSEYFQRVQSILAELVRGADAVRELTAALVENELVKELTLDVEFADNQVRSYKGIYGIDEEKLESLSGDVLGALHQKGFLDAIYMIIASRGQLRALIDRKNLKLLGSTSN